MVENVTAISNEKTSKKIFDLIDKSDLENKKIIDVGTGEGYFPAKLGNYIEKNHNKKIGDIVTACDLFPEQFKYNKIKCDKINANSKLPYEGNYFDTVASIEVIEHIEDQFNFIRELYRITKPGGSTFISTPNILNINSRIRFFYTSFGLLFDPLPLDEQCPIHCQGHINPISFYFLAYIFSVCGYEKIKLHVDRRKKSGIFLTALFYLPLKLFHYLYCRKLKKKKPKIYEENKKFLNKINSFDLLTSRSVIIEGIK